MKYTTFDWNIWWTVYVLVSKHPVLVLNKYNRISLFLYKWNVMHIFPSKKLHETVKETKENEGLRVNTKTFMLWYN